MELVVLENLKSQKLIKSFYLPLKYITSLNNISSTDILRLNCDRVKAQEEDIFPNLYKP